MKSNGGLTVNPSGLTLNIRRFDDETVYSLIQGIVRRSSYHILLENRYTEIYTKDVKNSKSYTHAYFLHAALTISGRGVLRLGSPVSQLPF